MLKTSDLCDACETAQSCGLFFASFGRRRVFSGRIRTFRYQGGLQPLRDLVNEPGLDQVLVVDGAGMASGALFGDVMAAIAIRNGWAGVVVNGAIRDGTEIDGMDIGVKALGTLPKRASTTGAGERDVPVTFGGVTFVPGLRLVADEDGVIVLPAGMTETNIDVGDALAATAAYVAGAKPTSHSITTLDQLQRLFGPVGEASLRKEMAFIHPVYRRWIEASPFVVLATTGADGLDVSPRGDPAGFVVVEDDRTLLLPERRGNNRIDSLRNILVDPRVALIFFIPGVGETVRVNGRATISTDPALLDRLAMEGKPPQCVLRISVETVFFQCARAMQRSRLWSGSAARPAGVPTAGEMLEALTGGGIDGGRYDRELPQRQRATLY